MGVDDGQLSKHFSDQDWESILQNERKALERRREGYLAKAIGDPLPGEDPQELDRLIQEDVSYSEQGKVMLRRGDDVWWKHIDDLTPSDLGVRIAARHRQIEWLLERHPKK
jgi:hypothetical protein